LLATVMLTFDDRRFLSVQCVLIWLLQIIFL
jgi:hypothetical protein